MQNSECLRELFNEAGIFENISPSALALLAAEGVLKKYEKGQHVFRDKDEVNTIYIIISGLTAIYKINSLGEKKIIFVYGSGNILNEVIVQELPASANCEIQETARLLCFPKTVFIEAMERDFVLTKTVLSMMSTKVRRLYRQLKNTSNSLRGDKRIAAKLWKLSNDHGKPHKDGTIIDMELSITYLADMVGSKRETVSRQIKLLTEQGLVIIKNNHFIVTDRKRLGEYFKNN